MCQVMVPGTVYRSSNVGINFAIVICTNRVGLLTIYFPNEDAKEGEHLAVGPVRGGETDTAARYICIPFNVGM